MMIFPSFQATVALALLLPLLLESTSAAASTSPVSSSDSEAGTDDQRQHNLLLEDFLNALAAVGATPSTTTSSDSNTVSVLFSDTDKDGEDAVADRSSSSSSQLRATSGRVRGVSSSLRQEPLLRRLKPADKKEKKKAKGKCKDLEEFQQWNDEVGYWIGEYTLLDGTGMYTVSDSWPYPYDRYTGFITGNIKGGAYRQRNVFLYDKNTMERCNEIDAKADPTNNPPVFPDSPGICGTNGNSLVFSADQSGCSDDGSISGSFAFGPFQIDTTTELIGADNALLYQVFSGGTMTQSQLTTIHQDGNRRTRTAQSFAFGSSDPAGTSYYRERKVTKNEFYDELAKVAGEYKILDSDLCTKNGFGRAVIYEQGGFQTCKDHLEQSFDL